MCDTKQTQGNLTWEEQARVRNVICQYVCQSTQSVTNQEPNIIGWASLCLHKHTTSCLLGGSTNQEQDHVS